MAYINYEKEGTPPLSVLSLLARQIVEQFECRSVLGANLTVRLISKIFRIRVNESGVTSAYKYHNYLAIVKR